MASVSSLGAGADAASLNSATTGTLSSVGSTPLLSSGPASALSGFNDSIAQAVKPLASVLQGITGANNLPLPNVLSGFATYNYIIGLSVLSAGEYNDYTYMNGGQTTLICKSAHIEPNNRPNTVFGKFEYYIDNLSFKTIISAIAGDNTHVTTLEFEVLEPYSMGLFMLALQTAAMQVGHDNWHDAVYLLTVEFRGNKETGQMLDIPVAKRYIPMRFTTVDIKVKESGTRYACKCFSAAGSALTERFQNLTTDVAIKGKTVQEALQTGEKSLQAVLNERLKQFKKDGVVNVPDEILILFPKNVDSASNAANNTNSLESTATATAAPSLGGDLNTKLGVTYSEVNQTRVQPEGECNEFGRASLGFDTTRKADTPISDDDVVYDPKTNVWVRGNATINVKETNAKFAQDSSIINAIDQIIMNSEYPQKALDANALDGLGRRKWWRVDPQMYFIDTKENYPKTGTKPKLMVYRVIPYNAHASVMAMPNTKSPGLDELKNTVVKVYDYIYTGKNTEVIKFDIDLKTSFAARLQSDSFKGSQDVRTQSETSSESLFDVPQWLLNFANSIPTGFMPSGENGSVPTTTTHDATITNTDKKGGGGAETASTRAARSFQETLLSTLNQINLAMEIQGDPYWFVQSGLGTYSATSSGVKNLNTDGTVEYQVDEVDIMINFRTPVDINQGTGMYNFGGASQFSPVTQFSGLYKITEVKNMFRGGKFTQELKGFRRQNQENKEVGAGSNTFNVSNLLSTLFG